MIEGHPALAGEPVTLEVLPEEIERHIPKQPTSVVLSYHRPNSEEFQRFVLSLEAFDSLATGEDMHRILQQARAAQEEERARQHGTNYASPEHAGEPHRGRATAAEQEYVRAHLDEVNARLRAKGMREIDATDPNMVRRYGLTPPEA